jgi:hypothetical protein
LRRVPRYASMLTRKTWPECQSVKSAEKSRARIDPNGYDAGQRISGKKRHILVDTLGLLLHAMIHPADIQDRDGGLLLVPRLLGMYPFLKSSLLTVAIKEQKFRNGSRRSAWPRS